MVDSAVTSRRPQWLTDVSYGFIAFILYAGGALLLVAIAIMIIVSLIPAYLNNTAVTSHGMQSRLLTMTYDLRGDMTSSITGMTVGIRQGDLANNKITIIEQILQQQVNTHPTSKSVRINVNHATVVPSSRQRTRQIDSVTEVKSSLISRLTNEESVTIHQTQETPLYSDQLIIFFKLVCPLVCTENRILYISRKLFRQLEFNGKTYYNLFADDGEDEDDNWSEVPADLIQVLSSSLIVPDVKDSEIVRVNDVAVYGMKDFTGNIQSIHAIQTTTAIYTFYKGRIAQIRSTNEFFNFYYNETSNKYMIDILTMNDSYQVPASYQTPNVSFPTPVYQLPSNTDPPNFLTGLIFEIDDLITRDMIDDAIVQLSYNDDAFGNKSIVMINTGAGGYYVPLPISNTSAYIYFDPKNFYTTLSRQSEALIALARTYPIADMCSQIPEVNQDSCTLIMEDLNKNIPDSLNIASRYTSKIPSQPKASAWYSQVQITIFIPGEQPMVLPLDIDLSLNYHKRKRASEDRTSQNPGKMVKIPITIEKAKGKCGSDQVNGAGKPYKKVINIGRAPMTIKFYYETFTVADQFDVYYKNKLVFQSGCISTDGLIVDEIVLTDKTSNVRVDVTPKCAGERTTEWYFYIECASGEINCNKTNCHCGVHKGKARQINIPTVNQCGAEGGFFNWAINPIGERYKFTDACDKHDICYGKCNNNKATCDDEFYLEASVACTKYFKGTDIYERCRAWAGQFYSAIDFFGGGAFREAQNQDCSCS